MFVWLNDDNSTEECSALGFRVCDAAGGKKYIEIKENPLDPTGSFRHIPAHVIKEITLRSTISFKREFALLPGLYKTEDAEVWIDARINTIKSFYRDGEYVTSKFVSARAKTIDALCKLLVKIEKGDISSLDEGVSHAQETVAKLGRG